MGGTFELGGCPKEAFLHMLPAQQRCPTCLPEKALDCLAHVNSVNFHNRSLMILRPSPGA